MPSDTKNVKLGVCKVFHDEVDLGYTKGGVRVEVQTATKEVTVDQFGQAPINEIITGRTVSVTVPLAETTLTTLVAITPGATLVTDAGSPTKKRVIVNSSVGLSLLDTAKMLRLHPKHLPDTDTSEDFVVPLANTPGSFNYAYELDNERVFEATFKGYPDPVTNRLFYVGEDPAAA